MEKSRIDPTEVEIGQRLRAFRRARGLTQSELGDLVGLSFQQVQKYERAENHLRVTTIMKCCEALHISPNDLLCVPSADVLKLAPDITREDPTAFELMRAFQGLSSAELKRSVIRLVQAAAGPVAGATHAPVPPANAPHAPADFAPAALRTARAR